MVAAIIDIESDHFGYGACTKITTAERKTDPFFIAVIFSDAFPKQKLCERRSSLHDAALLACLDWRVELVAVSGRFWLACYMQ